MFMDNYLIIYLLSRMEAGVSCTAILVMSLSHSEFGQRSGSNPDFDF